MPTITATAFPNEAYVLVEVDWTDVPAVTHARVIRTNTVTGEEVALRPYISYNSNGDLLLNCGLGLWWDTEPPLGVTLTYRTEAADVDTILTVNPDFETGVAGWTVFGGTFVQSGAFFHDGAFSGLLTPIGGVSPQVAQASGSVFVADKTLTSSAWVMSPQGWNSVVLITRLLYDDGIIESFQTPVDTLVDGQWRHFSQTIEPRTSGTIFAFGLVIFGEPPATTLFYLDEVQVSQLQPVTLTATSDDILLEEGIWLKNPLNPCLDIELGLCDPAYNECTADSRVSYVGMEDDELSANTVLLRPVNRRYPIPINRIRRSPVSVLRLLAHDCDARDDVLATNLPGDPLLFQAESDYCIPDRYISVGQLTEARLGVDQRDDFRLMVLPYAVVERPAGPANGPCGIRIVDLCDIYTSWSAMTIGGLDWMDLLLGEASHNSPGDPPLAGLRTWGEVETEFANFVAVEGGGTRDWGELRDGL